MPGEEIYLVPAKNIRVEFSVERSKFIASLFVVQNEELCRKYISEVEAEFSGATHHAYAYRLKVPGGPIERYSDAREPAGTAGLPMLQFLQGENIFDVLVVGTRYFGGIKLGIGGLGRAYRQCARLSVQKAGLVKKEPLNALTLRVSYTDYGPVNSLIEKFGASVTTVSYLEEVTVKIELAARESKRFAADFRSVSRGQGKIKWH